jgi:DNA-binding protein YbaB
VRKLNLKEKLSNQGKSILKDLDEEERVEDPEEIREEVIGEEIREVIGDGIVAVIVEENREVIGVEIVGVIVEEEEEETTDLNDLVLNK